MKDFKKVFLDTTPIIYLLDNDKNFGEKTSKIFSALSEQNVKFVSSFITVAEYLVYPYRMQNESLVKVFWDLVNENKMILYSIGHWEAINAAKIRAEYKHFKPMDALQLATAALHGCDLFLTNEAVETIPGNKMRDGRRMGNGINLIKSGKNFMIVRKVCNEYHRKVAKNLKRNVG